MRYGVRNEERREKGGMERERRKRKKSWSTRASMHLYYTVTQNTKN